MAGIRGYWALTAAAIAFRLLLLLCFPKDLHLGSRPEVATPLTSLRRCMKPSLRSSLSSASFFRLPSRTFSYFRFFLAVAEGNVSSMYHGSPLLLSFLGQLTIRSTLHKALYLLFKVCNFDLYRSYGRYIPVRQVTGTRTARYRAVPSKIDRRRSVSAVAGRLKKKSTVGGRLREIDRRRSIEEEKGKKKRKRKKKKKRGRTNTSPTRRPRLRAVVARWSPAAAFSPTRGD
ncbi:hypothetical protein BHE74_00046407 [Ensete ventricosum]|nr:hypothetical protein BHE74_00046407 [Ensete ventricosum]